jgi:hypothetical protein
VVVIGASLASETVGVSGSGNAWASVRDGERNADSKEDDMMMYLKRSANWRALVGLAGSYNEDSRDCGERKSCQNLL